MKQMSLLKAYLGGYQQLRLGEGEIFWRTWGDQHFLTFTWGGGEGERFYKYSTSKMGINIMAQWGEGAVNSFHVFEEGHKNILHVQAGGGGNHHGME